ncbi:MAG: hypothetical protein JWQ98_2124 [Chlorobi bacterium]|nr:hypothetical protein [Chlorobiota bacterium]
MADPSQFPRELSPVEWAWLAYLLPADRPGYARFLGSLDGYVLLGEGRWGTDDFVLGPVGGAEIDRTEGMQPIVAYGEIIMVAPGGREEVMTLAVHQPNDDGLVEFQISGLDAVADSGEWTEARRWSYSRWNPGNPCPATGGPVREIGLDAKGELLLTVSPVKRVLWLHDRADMTSTLVPVTNYYNELMLLKGIRDPGIALDHRRLFTALDDFTDVDLRLAFIRYNMSFRKIDPERLREATPSQPRREGLLGRVLNVFKGNGDD